MPRRHTVLLVAVTAAALAAGPLATSAVGAAAPQADTATVSRTTQTTQAAAAAESCSVVIGPRLAVAASSGSFPAALKPNCQDAGVTWATWDVVSQRTGETYTLSFSETSRSSLAYESAALPLGGYDVRPRTAINGVNCAYVDQAPTTATVKSQSKASASVSRSGQKVTLSARAVYFETGAALWRGWTGARVAVQQQQPDGTWKTLRTVTADADGRITYTVAAKASVSLRVAVQPTTRIWERITPGVRV